MPKIIVRCVKSDHYINQRTPSNHLSKAMHSWLVKVCAGDTDEAMIATYDGKLIGFFRYIVDYEMSKSGAELSASGTYVESNFRGCDLGYRLWRAALKKWHPRYVSITTTSKWGTRLVNRLRREYPNIQFSIDRNY